jgi:hypothetical protein
MIQRSMLQSCLEPLGLHVKLLIVLLLARGEACKQLVTTLSRGLVGSGCLLSALETKALLRMQDNVLPTQDWRQ